MIASTTKKRMLNAAMVLSIVLIAIAAVLLVGSIKSPAPSDDAVAELVVSQKSGNVNIERAGVGYALEAGATLRGGDTIETLSTSQLKVGRADDLAATLGEGARLSISDASNSSWSVERGLLFFRVKGADAPLELQSQLGQLRATDAVFFCSVYAGSVTVQVLSGEVLDVERDTALPTGTQLALSKGADGVLSAEVSTLAVGDLSDFVLTQAVEAAQGANLSFDSSDLTDEQQRRAANASKAQAESSAGSSVSTEAEAKANGASSSSSDEGSTASPGAADGAQSQSSANGSASDAPSDAGSATPAAQTCTIQIRCDTILSNMSSLRDGKSGYVPANGLILATSTVRFAEGDTVFDALKSVCSAAGLQLEYAWTPAFDSYYIEGINNLYEFDCGSGSGWMYQVNGWQPNYGCSKYALKSGDAITFAYTCRYGEDL